MNTEVDKVIVLAIVILAFAFVASIYPLDLEGTVPASVKVFAPTVSVPDVRSKPPIIETFPPSDTPALLLIVILLKAKAGIIWEDKPLKATIPPLEVNVPLLVKLPAIDNVVDGAIKVPPFMVKLPDIVSKDGVVIIPLATMRFA